MINRFFRPRSFFFVLLVCSPRLALPQQPSTPQPTPSDPVLVKRPSSKQTAKPGAVTPEGRIHLDVLVSDAAGKPVMGLEPQNFTLLDNNQPRRILSFRSYDGINVKPSPPVEVILLFDTLNLPFQEVSFTRQEIVRFLSQNGGRLAQPVSLMLLTDRGLRVQPRPSVDGNALVSVLESIKGSVSTINPAMGSDGALQRFQMSLRQMSTIAENEAGKPGRKLLIWVGPGWPMLEGNSFTFSDKDQVHYFDAIVELSNKLRESRIAIYSVSEPSPGSGTGPDHNLMYENFLKGVQSPRQADTGNLALKVLALESGGRILGPDNDLAGQIGTCIAEANAFYTISFNPPAAEHADEYHGLKVQLSQPGLTARTSTGYYDQPPQVPNVPD
ncbi:MAG: VWA domain-containing protein [Terracidiphilus sp.]